MNDRAAARFASKWVLVETGCWHWSAALDVHGYGRFRLDSGMRLAHRVSYEHAIGPIPEGLDLDHLCRNRSCVNPAHLEPVTRSENLSRSPLMGARSASLTHCRRDHELTDENVRLNSRGARVCLVCQRERWVRVDRDRPPVPCPSCGRFLRPKNLRDHVWKLHPIGVDS